DAAGLSTAGAASCANPPGFRSFTDARHLAVARQFVLLVTGFSGDPNRSFGDGWAESRSFGDAGPGAAPMLVMNQVRKRDTGEQGNPGQFGRRARSEASARLSSIVGSAAAVTGVVGIGAGLAMAATSLAAAAGAVVLV